MPNTKYIGYVLTVGEAPTLYRSKMGMWVALPTHTVDSEYIDITPSLEYAEAKADTHSTNLKRPVTICGVDAAGNVYKELP